MSGSNILLISIHGLSGTVHTGPIIRRGQKAGSDQVKAMDEIEMTDKVHWPQNGDAYDTMRNRQLDIIKDGK